MVRNVLVLIAAAVGLAGCPVSDNASKMIVGGATDGLGTYYKAPYNHFHVTNAAEYRVETAAPKETRTIKKFDGAGNLISEETILIPAYETEKTQTSTDGMIIAMTEKRVPSVMEIQRSIPYERQPVVNRGLIGGVVGLVQGWFGYKQHEIMYKSIDNAYNRSAAVSEAALNAAE
jgi:hypothetical protein